MSSLHRALGVPEPLALDDATLRRFERVYRRLEPDPLFRRRLRGEILNRYVAEREGYLSKPHARREMGRLGRAVLYASLGLAVSVSAAGAAADRSLPGDLLYGVKLQLEEIRMRIAPPSMRDDLAVMVLAERVGELEQLAASGSWRLVPAAAARVTEAETALVALGSETAGKAASQAVESLEKVLANAPPQAHAGLQRALDNVSTHAPAKPKPHPVKALRPDPRKPAHAAVRPSPASVGADEADDADDEPKRRPEHPRGKR
jgi:hypothetical protein